MSDMIVVGMDYRPLDPSPWAELLRASTEAARFAKELGDDTSAKEIMRACATVCTPIMLCQSEDIPEL